LIARKEVTKPHYAIRHLLIQRNQKEKLLNPTRKFSRIGMLKKDNYNQNNTSHITIKELIKRIQLYRPNIRTFYKKKNKPSFKILASTQISRNNRKIYM